MKYCSFCRARLEDDAVHCDKCGHDINEFDSDKYRNVQDERVPRFLLIWFLGFIGCFIINHSKYKPKGFKCRTAVFFFCGLITLGLYSWIVAICTFDFDPKYGNNIGYKIDPEDN